MTRHQRDRGHRGITKPGFEIAHGSKYARNTSHGDTGRARATQRPDRPSFWFFLLPIDLLPSSARPYAVDAPSGRGGRYVFGPLRGSEKWRCLNVREEETHREGARGRGGKRRSAGLYLLCSFLLWMWELLGVEPWNRGTEVFGFEAQDSDLMVYRPFEHHLILILERKGRFAVRDFVRSWLTGVTVTASNIVTTDFTKAGSATDISSPGHLTMKLGVSLQKDFYMANRLCSVRKQSNSEDDIGSDCSVNSEVINSSEVTSLRPCDRNIGPGPYRLQLEQDVHRLQQQLCEEMELHVVLENAIENAAGSLSGVSCLPQNAQELLNSIVTLEETVSRLEEQMVSLHYQLTQERNERKLAEYRLKQLPSELSSLSSSVNVKTPLSDKELREEQTDSPCQISSIASNTSPFENTFDGVSILFRKKASCQLYQSEELGKVNKNIAVKGLWSQPNRLSEEMVRCMKNIFISLSDSSTASSKSYASEHHLSPVSPHGLLSTSSMWSLSEPSTADSWVQSPHVDLKCKNEVLTSECVFDPYRVRGKLSWEDIGSYGSAVEVSWMSVGKKQLEFAAGALRRFRLLVEQLAKVNPVHLRSDEKLAFWINLYNALIMHAYLAYGVPRGDLKLFSLMQKAAYTVGGHSFNAATIEYVILKMKPPLHRPQTALLLALHKLKATEEQRKFAIDTFEPLVTFALSCGMYSSPAVRIYTAANVREELEEAQRDFIRASVGVSSKGKLLVPKLLHCFARGFVDDANLAVWISRFLPPKQAALVEQCLAQRRQSFLASRNCGILPFDSHFRYLFLPETYT
ncbi:hypothetical protein H6P81_010125 [Aristolochia fimbriata]|uniref:Uncharacterized protein n=1 Tax=Aristolochia fimbriata TaxID=158543 RepID=A0AAV7EQ08_ARIFI|nr:hypothetical protein H6P81_010125 [Aristolochia fimbriata]